MNPRPLTVVDTAALKELHRELKNAEPFMNESSVEDYDATLAIYESLLARAFGLGKSSAADAGLAILVRHIVERLSLQRSMKDELLELDTEVFRLRAMVAQYFGKRHFEGTIEEAEESRSSIVDLLGSLVHQIEESTHQPD